MTLGGPTPQPLGVLPWPAGLLLFPEGSDETAAEIVSGRIPELWPDDLRYVEVALTGDAEAAVELVSGADEVAAYNRAVLVGGEGVWEALAQRTTGDLLALVQTARYSIGQVQAPPSAEGLPDEIASLVLSAQASAAMEARDAMTTAQRLQQAVDSAARAGSPIVAATLRLTLAQFLTDTGDPARAARVADAAIQGLPLTADRELRAHLQLTRALARQQLAGEDRGALLAVVSDLNEATKVFREESHPELFALCNEQLALAYLVMPMSDQGDRLRLGVAVNALRAALRVFTRQTHPHQWAMTQVNLANALQYLPSVHQQDNLDEAVQLYEEVLQARDPNEDPIGYARILSNQGNALGHLGVFSDARQRLELARSIFAQEGDADAAATVDDILAGLAEAAGSASVRPAALRCDSAGRWCQSRRAIRRCGECELMELFARQHFDAILRDAAANFAERCVYRCGGAAAASAALAEDPQALDLDSFVGAFFAENLLEDSAGACFVLQALERRTVPADSGGSVGEVLARLARAAFADVLVAQAGQVLQQQQIYE